MLSTLRVATWKPRSRGRCLVQCALRSPVAAPPWRPFATGFQWNVRSSARRVPAKSSQDEYVNNDETPPITDAGKSSARRRPGRPRKAPVDEVVNDDKTPPKSGLESSSGRRRPGRPPKTPRVDNDEILSGSETGKKAARRRTAKSPPDEDVDEEQTPPNTRGAGESPATNEEREKILNLLGIGDPSRDPSQRDEPDIQWFEQEYPWSKERRLSDPKLEPYLDSNDEVKELKSEIDRLDKQIERLYAGARNPHVVLEPLVSKLDPALQTQVREAMDETVAEQKKLAMEKREEARRHNEFMGRLDIQTDQWNAYLRTLNLNLKRAAENSNDYSTRRKLWLSYARCKAMLPPFHELFTPEMWLVMFNTCTIASFREDPQWTSHVIELVQDMRGANFEVQNVHQMLLVEALRSEGRSEEAIAEWQNLGENIGDDVKAKAGHELVGVRLFTAQGSLDRAEKLASTYFRNDDLSDARILIPIIATWTQRKDETGMKHAWALYLWLKMKLGPKMENSDYDNVSIAFVQGGRIDLAMAVFKDRFANGDSVPGSVEIYQKSQKLIDRLNKSANSAPEANEISLAAVTVIPNFLNNAIFYGAWIRKLISLDEPDCAAAVIDLMYERGLRPAARNVNALLSCWIRAREADSKGKAETMAWAMISQRIKFVQDRELARETPSSDDTQVQRIFWTYRRHNKEDSEMSAVREEVRCPRSQIAQIEPGMRPIPEATTETFCLLLQHYLVRGDFNQARKVQDALRDAQLQPNKFWMNHLMYSDLYRGHLDRVWPRYTEFFHRGPQPDVNTFVCLWESLFNYLKSQTRLLPMESAFPTPRELMLEMTSWVGNQSKVQQRLLRQWNFADARRSTQRRFLREINRLVLSCMIMRQDLPGAIASLYLMRNMFTIYPSTLMETDVTHALWVMLSDKSKRSPELEKTARRRITSLAQIFVGANKAMRRLRQQREDELIAVGIDQARSKKVRQSERLFLMTMLLRYVMRESEQITDEQCDLAIYSAIKQMYPADAESIDTADPLPLYRQPAKQLE